MERPCARRASVWTVAADFPGRESGRARPAGSIFPAQHAPDGAALCAARQRLDGGRGLSVVGRRGVPRHHDAFGREVGTQRPGVLAFLRRDLTRRLGRPEDAGRAPYFSAEFLGEIGVGFRARNPCKWLESRAARFSLGRGQGRVALALEFLVQPLADDGPIAEVVGYAPDEADVS